MSFIEINNVTKKYGSKVILDELSMSVEKGQCVAIVGQNGCGKSTLLSILAGTKKPDSGMISYNGEEADKHRDVVNKYVGYVPQENPLMSGLTVYDNLRFWYCDTDSNLEEDFRLGILKEFGLDQYRKYPVDKLSGGLKKRLSIACALASKPQVLIMDEPGAALDIICKEDIKSYLKKYLKMGGTVIIASHEETELAICDKMYLLSNGKMQQLKDKPLGSALFERMKRGE